MEREGISRNKNIRREGNLQLSVKYKGKKRVTVKANQQGLDIEIEGVLKRTTSRLCKCR
jgi:hypothetical protein